MVIYDLCCENQHQFEGWFKDSDDMQQQIKRGILRCPVCESHNIIKMPTASKLSKSGKHDVAITNNKQSLDEYNQAQKILGKVHEYLDQNYVDVGNNFADEAMKMHKGEKEEQNIRGIASKKQINELHEAGVATLPIPPKPVEKKNLN